MLSFGSGRGGFRRRASLGPGDDGGILFIYNLIFLYLKEGSLVISFKSIGVFLLRGRCAN